MLFIKPNRDGRAANQRGRRLGVATHLLQGTNIPIKSFCVFVRDTRIHYYCDNIVILSDGLSSHFVLDCVVTACFNWSQKHAIRQPVAPSTTAGQYETTTLSSSSTLLVIQSFIQRPTLHYHDSNRQPEAIPFILSVYSITPYCQVIRITTDLA